MSKLLEAAKDFIEAWEARLSWKLESKYLALRSAVEQEQNQNCVGFDKWWATNSKYCDTPYLVYDCWITAQQAERQRIISILYEVCKYQENFDLIIEKMYE